MNRRHFLKNSSGLSLGLLLPTATIAAPAIVSSSNTRVQLPSGVQVGDVLHDKAIVWARADRTARMMVQWDTTPKFNQPRQITGPWALESNDFITRVDLNQLPSGQHIFARIAYQDASTGRTLSEVTNTHFMTPTHGESKAIRFVWSGDTAGQGFGINTQWGGMRIYETMRQQQPHFFIHCGDTIYADAPIEATKQVEQGKIWTNIVTLEVAKVAETLHEYRGRYRYNLMDENIKRFAQEVPQIWQWDDHEVVNNWSDSKDLSADPRYTEKSIAVLQARATRAFLDYAPMRAAGNIEDERVYRHLPQGELLDLFIVDMRSYRGANSENLQTKKGLDTAFMGQTQIDWLLNKLKKSTATWKVICSDMPLGLQIADGTTRWEAVANGDSGKEKGREIEIAQLLSAIKKNNIHNIVWLTADVHYTAAHLYDPAKASFTDFNPFWEFVSGPLNAGSFGPNKLDMTFGPEVKFQAAPIEQNTSPFAELQFFGQVDIDPKTKTMQVALKDLNNKTLFTQLLIAQQ